MDSQKTDAATEKRQRGRPRAWDSKAEQNTIKSLDRAMEVFEHLSEASGSTLSEIASDLDQSPATVYRILITLEGRNLVEFDRVEQLWHIGARAFTIGSKYLRRSGLIERARPILRRLMEETGETANLGIIRENSVLFLSQVETHENIRAFFPPGTLSPPHASGIGKAMLAEMPEDRLARIIRSRNLERFTENTLSEISALMIDLQETSIRGYAIDDEEKSDGMRCIAAAVFDANGEAVAGLSVSGPSSRMPLSEADGVAQSVMQAADGLTAALGGRKD